jgi:DNA-directed RNA polymerase specialized sigma24 family protein
VKNTLSVERVWARNENKVFNTIVMKLKRSFMINTISGDELMSEAMYCFFKNFYRIYEHDAQYLSYLFIVMKNKIIDLKNRENKFYSMHLCLEGFNGKNKDEENFNIESMTKDERSGLNKKNEILEENIYEEIKIKISEDLPNNECRKIFALMLLGYKIIEISKELNITPNKVGYIRKNKIWPLAKKYMNIHKREYEYLVSSGRIYVS